MLRYAISDRRLFAGDRDAQMRSVVRQAAVLAAEGVPFFQVREKDLAPRELLALTIAVRDAVAQTGATMRVVLNGPCALARQAAVGWHRVSTSTEAGEAVSASCHTVADVVRSRADAVLLLFGPVFGKTANGTPVQPAVGLEALREACVCADGTPVLALGGVDEANAAACVAVGATGYAAIRAFQRG